MRQLYVCTGDFPNNFDDDLRPILIGVLREIKPGISPYENGEYEFQYMIGDEFHEYCLRLPKLNDPSSDRIYTNSAIRHLLEYWLPLRKNSMWFDAHLADMGLLEYDEWEWLKFFGHANSNPRYANLYEKLPKGVIRYDK